ncbi:MAG: phosphomannomutase/phosphoglucomutase [Oscillospiraceae bacterium]|jgi:phosphomannomutase|nr:phosphomannomutase/phosphoglucomutase [Oscillospiraceae bacterium]
MDTDWMALKSGSDIRGNAVDAPDAPATLTPDVARRVGFAFARWLLLRMDASPGALRVAVGRDSRVTGPSLAAAVLEGLALAGAHTLDFGLCTTPAMFLATVAPETACHGAVMVTASHHPWMRNGLKFFTRRGGLDGADIRALLAEAQAQPLSQGPAAPAERVDFLRLYADSLKRAVCTGLATDAPRPLAGLRVAVDAGNGAGGFYADMLSDLGADTSGSRYLQPDGRFPNHIPNPEDDAAMAALSQAVRESGADLGVIFDADCDRAAIVDEAGRAINRNRLIALTAAVLLAEAPGATVVTDSVTSAGLARFIAARGGVHCRYKRGYRNVIDEALRLNAAGVDCPLAMETSGHAALREHYFLDDGMYLVTRLLVAAMQRRAAGGALCDLIADLREPAESREARLAITAPDFATAGQGALDALTLAAAGWPHCRLATDSREGVRVLFDLDGGSENAWLMMRLSVHDPVLPVNMESDVPGGVEAMLGRLRQALQGCAGIDAAPLSR